MKNIICLLIGVCMILSVATAQAQSSPQDDEMSITRLENGLSVLILEDKRFPLVSTRLYVRAGSAYEEASEAGISHVLEHMVFKGTDSRAKGLISSEVESAGGYLNAATSFDYTMYLTDMPSRHFKLGMDIVRDMAFHPTLDKDELESEKKVILAELQRGLDDPDQNLFQALQKSVWANTAYQNPIIGYEDTINAITPEKMRAYIDKYYQPQSMLLVVVGDIDKDEVLQEAKRLFEGYKNTREVTELAPFSYDNFIKKNVTVNVSSGDWQKAYLSLALPGSAIGDTRNESLDVLTHILGGDRNSILWKKYKYEKQLVDSISVYSMNFERVGMIYINAELDPKNINIFIESLAKDLANLKMSNFNQKDINRAKLNLEDDLFRSKETLSGLASKVGYFQFFQGHGDQAEKNAINLLRAVDKNSIENALKSWFIPQNLSVAITAPKNIKLNPKEIQNIIETNWKANTKLAQANSDKSSNKTEIVDLGQGRKLILIPDKSMPYISVSMSFNGGEALLSDKQQGLSALMARVLTKGAEKLDATKLQAWLGDRAASIVAGTGKQTFSLRFTSPSRFSGDMFNLANSILHKPIFAKEEFEREKLNQIANIKAKEDQPLGYVFRKLSGFLFPNNYYGFDALGDIADLQNYKLEDIQNLWSKQIKQDWVLAVSGDFDATQVINAVKKFPKPSAQEFTPAKPSWGTDKELDLTLAGRNQAHYLLVFKTVPIGDKDAPALKVLENVLAGQSGLLFNDLRDDKGLGYTVTAFSQNFVKAGFLAFYIGTEPDKVVEAENGFKRIIKDLQTNILAEDEILRGKNQIEGDYYRGRQSLSSRAGEASNLILLGKPLEFGREQVEDAMKVTGEDLRNIANKYLDVDGAYIVKLLP